MIENNTINATVIPGGFGGEGEGGGKGGCYTLRCTVTTE